MKRFIEQSEMPNFAMGFKVVPYPGKGGKQVVYLRRVMDNNGKRELYEVHKIVGGDFPKDSPIVRAELEQTMEAFLAP